MSRKQKIEDRKQCCYTGITKLTVYFIIQHSILECEYAPKQVQIRDVKIPSRITQLSTE